MATSTITQAMPTGEAFKATREAAKATQMDVCRMVPMARSTLQAYEAGRSVKSLTLAIAITRTYKALEKMTNG